MHLSATDPSSASTAASVSSVTRDWTCPFCPLLCDDLALNVQGGGTLAAPHTDCPRLAQALTHYGPADARASAAIDGQDADLEAALAHAAGILAQARRPLFGGLATDVAGGRALYPLAAGCGAILDHMHGAVLTPGTLALQDRGSFFTTLAEIRTRADLLVFFGCQPAQHYPRFYARALGHATLSRELIFVGGPADPAAVGLAQARVETVLPDADPYDTLALWSALVEGHRADTLPDPSGSANALAALAARVAAARYTAFVYEPAAWPAPHAALLIEALQRIVKAVNRTTRAGCLALGGDDGGLTVNQTLTWLSGFPLRTRVSTPARLAGEAPLDHDPHRYGTARLLAEREIDALLWVASFGPQAWPAALPREVPAIVLGHPALAAAAKARGAGTVFIPVATPGIDSGGHLFRIDGTVVAPLTAARGAALPSVAALAARLAVLLAAMPARGQP